MPNVTNIDHATIDWTARILDLERIAHENGLEFNLIINAEESGGADMRSTAKTPWRSMTCTPSGAAGRTGGLYRAGTPILCVMKWCRNLSPTPSPGW